MMNIAPKDWFHIIQAIFHDLLFCSQGLIEHACPQAMFKITEIQ
jgi:hypothetical protein